MTGQPSLRQRRRGPSASQAMEREEDLRVRSVPQETQQDVTEHAGRLLQESAEDLKAQDPQTDRPVKDPQQDLQQAREDPSMFRKVRAHIP